MNKNIFWFIIDSVRQYKTGMDDRDRLDIMDQFAVDSVEFANCVTSAPSSLLSAGSLFTGQPAVFVSRHFNDWKFVDPGLSTISTLVKEHGYQSIPLIDSRDGREKYQEMLPPFPAKFLPKGYNLSDYGWTNKQITDVFENILTNHVDAPFAFVFWYDCRRDPLTSNHVQRALQLIKDHGYYDDSIIVMNSDHGYPDPKTSLNESFFKNLGHDMILTDDNIKTPLLVKYPDCPAGKKITNTVGLIDILPTIFDVLKIPMDKKNDAMTFRGKSLLSLIDETDISQRVVRTDTRLRMDDNKIVSYRSDEWKYIKFIDDDEVILYDLKNDPEELKDLSNKNEIKYQDAVTFFETIDKEYEEEIIESHSEILKTNFQRSVKSICSKNSDPINLVIISPAPQELIQMLIKFLGDFVILNDTTIVNTGPFDLSKLQVNKIITTSDLTLSQATDLNETKIDVLIYLTHNSRRVYLKNEIVKSIGKVKSSKKVLMNYNFEVFDYFSIFSLWSYIKLFFDFERKWYFYKQEPKYFFVDLWFYISYSIKYYLKKKKSLDISGDIMTAREVMAYRNFHLNSVKDGVLEMDQDTMEYETERIKDWGNE